MALEHLARMLADNAEEGTPVWEWEANEPPGPDGKPGRRVQFQTDPLGNQWTVEQFKDRMQRAYPYLDYSSFTARLTTERKPPARKMNEKYFRAGILEEVEKELRGSNGIPSKQEHSRDHGRPEHRGAKFQRYRISAHGRHKLRRG